MALRVDALISSAIVLEGHPYRAAYDPNHGEVFGYWICTVCKLCFYRGRELFHDSKDEDRVYVLGPKEIPLFSRLGKEEIHKVQRVVEHSTGLGSGKREGSQKVVQIGPSKL